jgi:hypothetical protein
MPSIAYARITGRGLVAARYAAGRRAERNCTKAVFSATGSTWLGTMAGGGVDHVGFRQSFSRKSREAVTVPRHDGGQFNMPVAGVVDHLAHGR